MKRIKNKRLLWVIGVILISVIQAHAQNDTVPRIKNEFTIGYGIIPSTSYSYVFSSTNDHFSASQEKIGAICVSYTPRRAYKKFGFGITICYDPVRMVYTDKTGAEPVTICKVKEDCISFMLHFKYYWYQDKDLTYYSKIAAPLSFCCRNYRQEEYHPDIYEVQAPVELFSTAFQCTFFGVDFKTEYCAGFVQFGIGHEGICTFGLRYEF